MVQKSSFPEYDRGRFKHICATAWYQETRQLEKKTRFLSYRHITPPSNAARAANSQLESEAWASQVNPVTIIGRLSRNITLNCKYVYILHSSSNYNFQVFNLLDSTKERTDMQD